MTKNNLFYMLLLGSAALLQACGGNKKESAPSGNTAKNVSAFAVEEQIVTGYQEYPAYVVPLMETELRAEVSGYVTSISVADGAIVAKGQKLYEIDRTRYAAEVERAKATLAIAESDLERVNRDLGRYKKLAASDAIARQTLDYAETDLINQRAQVQSAKAALENANTNLNRSVIYAPFAGSVGISQVRTGALVTAGTTLLNTLSTSNPITVEFQVNERDIDRVLELQKSNASSGIEVRLPDGSIYGESGKISVIDRAIDRTTGTLRVRATFQNPQGKLRAGMNLTLRLANTSLDKQLVVPLRAVIEQLGAKSIFTISDSSTAVFNQVQLGTKFDDKVVVLKGLQAGQQVVVDGASNLSEGDKLSIQQK